LPDGKGDAWIEDLRSQPATAGIPIIMMTGGYPTPALTAQLAAAGIPLLIKPFSLEHLVARIRELTERERAIGAA
jgi:DNA-binding response OmpR family regulator